MIMSFKDAQNYKEYADSTDDLIKKCEDIVNNLTPEEANAKCNCIILQFFASYETAINHTIKSHSKMDCISYYTFVKTN